MQLLKRQKKGFGTIEGLRRDSHICFIDPSVFRDPEWDYMDPERRDRLLGIIYSALVARAKDQIPFYAELYREIDVMKVNGLEDILKLPVVRKEGTRYSIGLREAIRRDRNSLKPRDVRTCDVWTTTGSTGMTQIPIFYTSPWDYDIENNAVARLWDSIGIKNDDSVYDCYNPAHVGGYMFPGVCRIVGAKHRFKPPEFTLEDTVRELDEWKSANSPFTVLLAIPSSIGDPLGRKGTNFENLYNEHMEIFGEDGINKVFLIGSVITPELIERIEREMIPKGIKVSGAYGTAEHRPLAYSPVDGIQTRVCKYNQQHLTLGPHYLFIGRDEGGRVTPISTPGEEGEVYTIGLRYGTPFILYKTGDLATIITNKCACGRTTPVIGNIRRQDPSEIAGVGCRYD